MSAPWIIVCSIIALAVLYVLLPLVAETFSRFRGRRLIRCPVTGEEAKVDVDAGRAALTSAFGRVFVRIKGCTLWPERKDCAQDCAQLPEIGARGVDDVR
jgi:hypothetical protein